jgi:hypothetical protein
MGFSIYLMENHLYIFNGIFLRHDFSGIPFVHLQGSVFLLQKKLHPRQIHQKSAMNTRVSG